MTSSIISLICNYVSMLEKESSSCFGRIRIDTNAHQKILWKKIMKMYPKVKNEVNIMSLVMLLLL